ncbi:hypothetical protein AURDEDRAFT_63914 [Auricularia subglabra TFB-10046 SS5]|nr:hypothetical protein AURDEDRAFT_63914 [Auricularia subglabra TFB-10046 SS5]
MALSLSSECTPLKQQYDACFNTWFESYLEPVVKADSPEERAALQRAKAEEYETRCGGLWAEYRDCVQRAVEAKGLTTLLGEAREENPLNAPPAPPSSGSESGSAGQTKT